MANQIWSVYAKHFDDLESARNEWSREALGILNKVAEQASRATWAKLAKLQFEIIPLSEWFQKKNMEFCRSAKLRPGSQYKFELSIRFGTLPNQTGLKFFTHVACWLGHGGALRKGELELVKQFVQERGAILDPKNAANFYFKDVDASEADGLVDKGIGVVSETLKAISDLKDLLSNSGRK